jgi:hypothetical protein
MKTNWPTYCFELAMMFRNSRTKEDPVSKTKPKLRRATWHTKRIDVYLAE